MAKRKTIQEKEIEAMTKKHLDDLGRKISVEAKRNSKIAKSSKNFTGGSLRDSGNYNVKPYNTINLYQNQYGKWNTPKGKPTPKDRSNISDTPLLNSIEKNVEEGVKVLAKDLISLLVTPFKSK